MSTHTCDLTLTHNGTPVPGADPITRAVDVDDAYYVGPNGLVAQWLAGEVVRIGGDVSDRGYGFEVVDITNDKHLLTFRH